MVGAAGAVLRNAPVQNWHVADGAWGCRAVCYRPVEIDDNAGRLLEQINFTPKSAFNRADLEFTAFVEDHWSPTPKVAFDYGGRFEHQRLASSLRIAPRAGVAYTPFDSRTILRRLGPILRSHPARCVHIWALSGPHPDLLRSRRECDWGAPVQYVNVIGSITGPRSFLVRGAKVTGGFAPRGMSYNGQLEHQFSRFVHARATYTDSHSVGLITFEPDLLGTTHEIVLNGDGKSTYKQFETTCKLSWDGGQQLTFSYTRSRAKGTLNDFDQYLGNFPSPKLRPVTYSNLPADLPNRFVMWGLVKIPFWKLDMEPMVEFRTGFPYARLDILQNYVDRPYDDGTRFPAFFSADTRVSRDFQVTQKYAVRLSLTGLDLTNHFNALQVHNNTADPQ